MITQAQLEQQVNIEALVYKRKIEWFLVRKDKVTRTTDKAILADRWYPKSAIIREDTYITDNGKQYQVYVMAGWLWGK
jgi:hypothetical protein